MCLQTIELSLRVAYHRGPGCAREQHSKSWKLSAVDKHGAAGSIEVDTRPGEYTGSILFLPRAAAFITESRGRT